jgi:hypothetical protein
LKKKKLTHKQISSVPCPTCGSAAGKRCVLHSGGLRSEPHIERKFLAIDAIAKTCREAEMKMAKFHTGQLVYNRSTKEDGFVSSVWVDDGVITYEVWVPKDSNSWESGHWISHWLEDKVKLSANKGVGSPLPN